MNPKKVYLAACVTLLVVLAGCASHYSAQHYDPYGFWSGIWHGIVAPFALIAMLVSWFASVLGFAMWTDVRVIGLPNTGWTFYYIGFVIGLLFWAGGSRATQ